MSDLIVIDKKVTLDWTEVHDTVPFALLGTFAYQARKEGWEDWEIEKVIAKAREKDYDRLLNVLVAHTK